jgi:hypothetical protein
MAEKWDWDREFEDAGTPGHRYARPVKSVLLIFGDGDDDFWRIEGMSDEVVKDIVRLHNADCCLAPAPSREEHRKLAQTIWAGIWDRKINLEGLTQVLADCFPALSRGVCDNMRHSVEPHAFVPEECADWRVEAPAPGHDEPDWAVLHALKVEKVTQLEAEVERLRHEREVFRKERDVSDDEARDARAKLRKAEADLARANEQIRILTLGKNLVNFIEQNEASDPVATEKFGICDDTNIPHYQGDCQAGESRCTNWVATPDVAKERK